MAQNGTKIQKRCAFKVCQQGKDAAMAVHNDREAAEADAEARNGRAANIGICARYQVVEDDQVTESPNCRPARSDAYDCSQAVATNSPPDVARRSSRPPASSRTAAAAMATKQSPDYIWSEDDIAWLKQFRRPLQNRFRKISDMVSFVQNHIPQFAEQVSKAAQPAIEAAEQLLKVDVSKNHRKYQPISPDRARQLLDAFNRGAPEWNTLLCSPEFFAAHRDAARRIRFA